MNLNVLIYNIPQKIMHRNIRIHTTSNKSITFNINEIFIL